MDANQQISQVIQKRLGGDYKVQTRVNYWQYDVDNKADAGFVLVVKNPLIESDPEAAKKQILKVLSEIDPLKAHIKFESETNHMDRLAKELEYFRAQELASKTNVDSQGRPYVTIHNKAPEWFRELPKRSGYNIKHALSVNKGNTDVININISAPKDAPLEDIVSNIQNRKAAILETLADRVVKYTESAKTPEEKLALKEKVKRLEFNVTSSSTDDSKTVHIEIMSPEQLAATKLPGGFTPDRIKELSHTNPLTALQNGEDDQDKTPGKPQPHLQKALARAILFSGDKRDEILPYILGKEDMRRMVGKSLTNLKAHSKDNPELVKRIDAFLADSVFKDHSQWGKPVENQEDIAQTPVFNKVVGDMSDPSKPYEPGVMTVSVRLPAEKFTAIRDQIAALDAASPAQPQQAGADSMEKAADALVQVAEKLMSWVERVDSVSKAPQVSAANPNEALAEAIIASAAASSQSTASTIVAGGPTKLLSRAEKGAGDSLPTLAV